MHVQTQAPHEQPTRIRLICLACSRQQLEQYRQWAEALSEPVEVIAVDLPATACLDSVDPDESSHALASALGERLEPFLQHPMRSSARAWAPMRRWHWRNGRSATGRGRPATYLLPAVTARALPAAVTARPCRCQ